MSFLGVLVENELRLRHFKILKRCKELGIVCPVVEVDFTEMPFQITIGSRKLFAPKEYDEAMKRMWERTLRDIPEERGTGIVRVLYPLGLGSKYMVTDRDFGDLDEIEPIAAADPNLIEFYDRYYTMKTFEGDVMVSNAAGR